MSFELKNPITRFLLDAEMEAFGIDRILPAVNKLIQENKEFKEELNRIQRLPHMDKARASAVIMQVASQLNRISEFQKAEHLKEAVDRWTTYTTRIEAERDKLLSILKLEMT